MKDNHACVMYKIPPSNYEPPTKCARCFGMIFFGPVIGWLKWQHVIPAGDRHEVRLDRRWWESQRGRFMGKNTIQVRPLTQANEV